MSQVLPHNQRVFALVLAAGTSSRFGSTKQLARVGQTTLVNRAVTTAFAACGERTVLVVGHDWENVIASCGNAGFIVRNDTFASGMGSSIALAVRAVAHVADAVVIMLADQPAIPARHIRTLIDAWQGTDNQIVASSYAGTAGAPVLLPRLLFDELSGLVGDKGAKRLFELPGTCLTTIACEAAGIDIDTPADLERLPPGL